MYTLAYGSIWRQAKRDERADGDDWAYFESAQGTAPDIASQGIINPTDTLESAEMMLRHLGLETPADRLDRAIAAVYVAGERLTPDRGGNAGTEDFATAVIDALA